MNSPMSDRGIKGFDFNSIASMDGGQENPERLLLCLKNFFSSIKSKNPLPFQKDLAEVVLRREHRERPFDPIIVDLLSVELCSALNLLGEKICLIGKTVTKSSRNFFLATEVYTDFLVSLGKNGEKYAQKVKKQVRGAVPDFWFLRRDECNSGRNFFHSPALTGLTRVLWQDRIKFRVTFDQKFPPSIFSSNFKRLLSIILCSQIEPSVNPSIVLMMAAGQVIGKVNLSHIPLLHSKKVTEGLKNLNTVASHKFIRHAICFPFDQKLRGIKNFKEKAYDGGFTQLGKELGMNQKQSIFKLSTVVWALNYIEAKTQVGFQKLVEAKNFRSLKTGRENGLKISTLPCLVGYGDLDSSGKLLTPIPTIPPPVHGIAPRQYHSLLYCLQMALFGEFASKSKDFARAGKIKIGRDTWERLLKKSKIPLKYAERILCGWTCNQTDVPMLVKSKEDENFTLGPAYQKVTQFLQDQGKLRIKQSNRAKRQKKQSYFSKNK